MLTWAIVIVSFWVGYFCSYADERDADGSCAAIAAFPTILTIIYLCLVGLGLV